MNLSIFKTLIMTVFMAAFALVFCNAAFAADQTFPIEFQDALTGIVSTVFTIVSVVIVWLGNRFFSLIEKKTNFEIEDNFRTYLYEALDRGIVYGRNLAFEKAGNLTPLETDRELIALAANYVLDKVPDALEYFGLTDEAKVKDLIIARLEKL